MTNVQIAVARFESTSFAPTLARTALRPTNNLDNNAQCSQFFLYSPNALREQPIALMRYNRRYLPWR